MRNQTSYRNVSKPKAKHLFTSFSAVLMLVMANDAFAQSPAPATADPAPAPTASPSDRTVPARRPAPPARPEAAPARAIAGAPPMVSEPASIDFGFLPPNTPGEGIVLLRNTSDKPLTINLVQPSCKCTTTSDLVGKQIPPGGNVELQIKLDGAPAMGVRRSSVKVMVDGYGSALDVAV